MMAENHGQSLNPSVEGWLSDKFLRRDEDLWKKMDLSSVFDFTAQRKIKKLECNLEGIQVCGTFKAGQVRWHQPPVKSELLLSIVNYVFHIQKMTSLHDWAASDHDSHSLPLIFFLSIVFRQSGDHSLAFCREADLIASFLFFLSFHTPPSKPFWAHKICPHHHHHHSHRWFSLTLESQTESAGLTDLSSPHAALLVVEWPTRADVIKPPQNRKMRRKARMGRIVSLRREHWSENATSLKVKALILFPVSRRPSTRLWLSPGFSFQLLFKAVSLKALICSTLVDSGGAFRQLAAILNRLHTHVVFGLIVHDENSI